jgi:hypothetical protein
MRRSGKYVDKGNAERIMRANALGENYLSLINRNAPVSIQTEL